MQKSDSSWEPLTIQGSQLVGQVFRRVPVFHWSPDGSKPVKIKNCNAQNKHLKPVTRSLGLKLGDLLWSHIGSIFLPLILLHSLKTANLGSQFSKWRMDRWNWQKRNLSSGGAHPGAILSWEALTWFYISGSQRGVRGSSGGRVCHKLIFRGSRRPNLLYCWWICATFKKLQFCNVVRGPPNREIYFLEKISRCHLKTTAAFGKPW